MKVIILGGFLGSGKTTVLLQLAKYITANSRKEMALAIIENEIGEISVDGAMLSGYQVKELSAGCICCTLTAGLGTALHQIHGEYDPEYVLIEATGLAMVDKITGVIRQYLPEVDWLRTLVLADASRWDDLMEGMDVFLENQLRGGDIVLLNKCDLVSHADQERLCREIGKMHPKAKTYPINANQDITGILIDILEVTQ